MTCRFWSARCGCKRRVYHWRGSYSPGKITEPDYLVKQYVCLSRGRGSVPMKNNSVMGICESVTPTEKEATKKARFQGVIMIFPARWEKTPWQWSKCDSVCQDRQHAQKENESYEFGSPKQLLSVYRSQFVAPHMWIFTTSPVFLRYSSTPILSLGWPVMSKEWSAYTVWWLDI